MFRPVTFLHTLNPGRYLRHDPTLVYDTFTDTNGTTLQTHTIAPTNTLSATWSKDHDGSNFSITGNVVVSPIDGSMRANYWIDFGVSDCVITCDAKDTSGINRDVGIMARKTDKDNCWLITLDIGGTDRFRITEVTGAVETDRATSIYTDGGGMNAIAATLNGTTISATLNGANDISYGSASQYLTNTKHGLVSSITVGNFDNFKVVR